MLTLIFFALSCNIRRISAAIYDISAQQFRHNKLGAGPSNSVQVPQTRRKSNSAQVKLCSSQTLLKSNSAQVKLGPSQTRRKSNSAQVKLCTSQTRRRSNSAQVKLGAGQTPRRSNSAQVRIGAEKKWTNFAVFGLN